MNDTIEISNQSVPPALREALDAAYVKRDDEARPNAEEAGKTRTRAQRIKADAAERVLELERLLETATTEQAHRLEAAIAAGAPTDDASPPNLDTAAIAQDLNSARLHDAIAGKALKSIEAAHAKAQGELAAAERDVAEAVDRILDEEQLAIARKIHRLLDEAVALGRPLFLEALADEMHTRRRTPAEVSAVLTRIDPLIDRMNIAGNVLRTGNSEAIAARAARRAEMLLGESAPVDETAAA
jgi:hypothetical protein